MTIAIPTNNKKRSDDKIAEHFDRAKNFLIYDTETDNFNILQNPEAVGKTELPPDFLYSQKVEAVIAFSLGPKAYKKFKNYGIEMYKAVKGTIADNLKKFESGKLRGLKEDIF